MSATTSPWGSSSGRASVPGPMSRASVPGPMSRAAVPGSGRTGTSRPTPARAGAPRGYDDWPPRGSGGTPRGPVGPPRGPGGGNRPGRPYKGRRKPRWGRIAAVAAAVLLVVALFAGVSLYGYANGLNDDLKRTNAFEDITQ